MSLGRSVYIVAFLFMAAGCASTRPEAVSSEAGAVIRSMERAYAERDLDAMMAVFADDIEWMAVEGDRVTMVADNPGALRAMMAENLAAYPDAVWEIERLQVLGPYVTTTEYAAWDGGASWLRNVVVYEVREGHVRRIWYYPSVDEAR